MYSTSELDELFQILNLIEKDLNLKGLEPHWSNTTSLLEDCSVSVSDTLHFFTFFTLRFFCFTTSTSLSLSLEFT